MKWLYSDILKEKKALKTLVILLVTVNAIVLAVLLFGIVLAVLLFGPSKKPDASVRKPENAAGSNQSGMVLNTSEETDIEENKSDSEADNLEADTGSEEAGAEEKLPGSEEEGFRTQGNPENLPGSEEEDFRTQGNPEEEPDQAEDLYDNENPDNTEDLYNEGNLNKTEETEGTEGTEGTEEPDGTEGTAANPENTENDTAYGSDTEEAPGSGPVLELTDEHITLRVGEEFDYYKYIKTMEDRDGSSLSRYIHLSQIVNTWIPGDYTVTYRITSPIDGQSVSKDLLVTVE